MAEAAARARRAAADAIRVARLILVLAASALPALAADDPTPLDKECSVPESMLRFADGMDELREALRRGKPIEIVALGSSSTEGAGAGSPDLAYPARLQAELAKRFPGVEIHVDNRGIGGQLAREMLQRLKSDVIDRKPDLVIWQTGTNDALARIDPGTFAETLQTGIDRLEDAGIPVMLMDLQYYPSVRNPEAYERYVAAMAKIAEEEDVPLVPRFALMRFWSDRQPKTGSTLWSPDHFHMGAMGYRCIGAVLAEAIEREVKGWPTAPREGVSRADHASR